MSVTQTKKAPAIPRRFTKRRKVRFWGEEYQVGPAVADNHLGDGRTLLWFEPLNTRPDYYLIRVDSSWGQVDEDHEYDLIDEVIDALEEAFSGNEDRLGFPVLSLDSGYCWGVMARWDGQQWLERPVS